MNILNHVTSRILRKNKVRTLFTIAGIILAGSLISGVATLITSFQGYMVDTVVASQGSWQTRVNAVATAEVQQLQTLPEKKDLVVLANLGYAKVASQNDFKPYLFVQAADRFDTNLIGVNLREGRLPESSGEILLPAHLASNGGVRIPVGQALELKLGDRINPQGKIMGQGEPLVLDDQAQHREQFTARETRRFTVVGIYERSQIERFSAPGYTALTCLDQQIGDRYTREVFLTFHQPATANKFMRLASFPEHWQVETHESLLRLQGATGINVLAVTLYVFAMILIALVMVGSISFIYNAFAISVSDRTQQFGLLSSIGATGKQIRNSVFFEALLLSVIGIPLGLLAGLGGIAVTLRLISPLFAGSMMLAGPVVPIRFQTSWGAIVLAVGLSLVTVLISAAIPARRASRISAIDAIRQARDVRIQPRDVRAGRIFGKLFGLEGLLAAKYYKRNRKRYRATIFSIAISIILFIGTTSLTGQLTRSMEAGLSIQHSDFLIDLNDRKVTTEQKQKLQEQLTQVAGLTDLVRYNEVQGTIELPRETLAPALQDVLGAETENASHFGVGIRLLDQRAWDHWLQQLGIKLEHQPPQEQLSGILINRIRKVHTESGSLHLVSLFAKRPELLTTSLMRQWSPKMEEYEDLIVDVQIGAMVERLPDGFEQQNDQVLLFMPARNLSLLPDDVSMNNYIRFNGADNKQVERDALRVLEDNQVPSDQLTNLKAIEQASRNTILILRIFTYGFITLISLICVVNVLNTISTGISLRRRELAMLKAVGQTLGRQKKQFALESIIYGIRALVISIPLSLLVSYQIHRANRAVGFAYQLPWRALLIAVLAVAVIVSLTTIYAVHKLNRESTIDALRRDAI